MLKSKKRHINIPIFIPHLGCPNQCVFCNQKSISGKLKFERESVREEIETALATIPLDAEVEIAFFGGSFTGIDRTLMIYLLDTAEEYISKGLVTSIRMSTRPDYISEEILKILSKYSVGTIELGLQSMDDEVLRISKRGHDRDVAVNACRAVKNAGFRLVGQMMIGLPGSTEQSEAETAKMICSLGADAARVYPTVVFYGTELCLMTDVGEYKPLSELEAVERTAKVLKIFDEYRVPCIRVGLCASENLSDESEVRGGANQSAVGEMAMSLLFREKIERELLRLPKSAICGNDIAISVPHGCASKAAGHKKCNKKFISESFGVRNVGIFESDSLEGYEVSIEIKDKNSEI